MKTQQAQPSSVADEEAVLPVPDVGGPCRRGWDGASSRAGAATAVGSDIVLRSGRRGRTGRVGEQEYCSEAARVGLPPLVSDWPCSEVPGHDSGQAGRGESRGYWRPLAAAVTIIAGAHWLTGSQRPRSPAPGVRLPPISAGRLLLAAGPPRADDPSGAKPRDRGAGQIGARSSALSSQPSGQAPGATSIRPTPRRHAARQRMTSWRT